MLLGFRRTALGAAIGAVLGYYWHREATLGYRILEHNRVYEKKIQEQAKRDLVHFSKTGLLPAVDSSTNETTFKPIHPGKT